MQNMSEQASNVSREAKGLQQSLKEILKVRDPWDREVDFQRKNLRRQYLRLLLVHPYTKESKDAETHLWMQTSYAFIAVYKQRIAALDRMVHSAPRQDGHGPVEYRKLMQRFRQFLADEEKFWTQLVVRFRRSFALGEVQSALVALGILATTDAQTGTGTSEVPESAHHAREGGAQDGRNHHQFPLEDETMSVTPTTSVERDGQLTIVSKALVCIGDIARYRELYNESGGRPKAGHEDNVVLRRSGRNKRGGGDTAPRARNYEKAQQCYEQARLLVPYEGNPWHQLAILSTYKKNPFESLVHYYRALCVRQPYDTAAENLGTVLTKALDQWNARTKREKESGGVPPPVAPRLRYEAFKDKIVILHALWRLGVDKMDSTSPNHAQIVCDDFASLISERGLPPDDICRAIVLSQGALWKHRMVRDLAHTTKQSETSPVVASASAIESRIFNHLLALHQALLDLGIVELAEPPPMDAAANDLAQRITATFRRTLPALRIASKWLRANFKYVLQAQESETAKDGKEKSSRAHTHKRKEHQISGYTVALSQFWESYSKFASALWRAFPVDRLPALTSPLEEDVDMRGFLPLRKMMSQATIATTQKSANEGGSYGTVGATTGQVHPNEEQLMRIADLLDDAQRLVEMENTPITPFYDRFTSESTGVTLPPVVPEPVLLASQHELWLTPREELDPSGIVESEDDAMTDPVRAAFGHLDGPDWGMEEDQEENIEDEDEILYPRNIISVLPSSPTRISPSLSPIGTPARPYTRPSPFVTPANPTTAQDLLFNMLPQSRSSAPQPPLLFGSAPNRLGHSIWSSSPDDQSHTFPGPLESPQSIWSPSYQHVSQISPSAVTGSESSSTFIPQQHSIANGGHQRTHSSPAPTSRPFTNQYQTVQDPFEYSLIVPPQSQRTSISQHDGYTNSPGPPMIYGQAGYPDYHGHHIHPHVSGFTHPFGPAPLSQVWGNSG